MNKKFSTLVASLLLSSAFSVYAGNAKPMLATPTQVETRATSADVEEAVEVTSTLPEIDVNSLKGHVLPGFTNNARIAYIGALDGTSLASGTQTYEYFVYANPADGVSYMLNGVTTNYDAQVATNMNVAPNYYWTLVDGRLVANNDIEFSLSGLDEYIEVVPIQQNGKATPFFAIAKRDANGNLQYAIDATNFKFAWSANKATDYTTNIQEAGLFVSVETAYTEAYTGSELNNYLKEGFNLAISSLKDETAEITHSEAFDGVLKAVENVTTSGNPVLSTANNVYHLMNEDGKYIWFDKDAAITSDGYSLKGQFKLVDFTTASSTSNDFGRFQFKKADNGSGLVQVLVGDDVATNNTSNRFNYRLYIANVNDTYGLSIAEVSKDIPAENWAATTLDASTIVNPKKFLTGQFYTIDYKGNVSDAAVEEYKKDGRLAIRNIEGQGDKADFVPVSGLYEKAPEAQWAVSASYDNNKINGFILKNRENPSVSVTITELRSDMGRTDYRVVEVNNAATNPYGIDAGDYITITPVVDHKKNDGYAVFDANDLRNKTWYLGQTRQTADNDINVYWAENHIGSHQIGATVEEDKASKWNLSVVKKELAKHENETDSVLVVSTLNKWNSAKSRIDAVQDTLVILPYAFQNRSNAEFVKFNAATNLNYYECREYNLGDDKVYDKTNDARFALKMKANGSYNFVAVDANTYEGKDEASVVVNNDGIAAKKVFQENSALLGTWSQMDMYAKDANSLMFVTEVTAPEYRKLVSELGVDTVKIYRAENEAQVVYEKRDAKSVVEGRTLSFLNIDNDVQFGEINPALYVDTAYVNRGNNTRYQYLLGVNVTEHKGFYCPEHGFATERPCEHAEEVIYKTGRYLINMIDTANIMAADLKVSIHNNPYINETEEGNYCAKLSFVDAIHVLKEVSGKEGYADQLYVINNGDTTALDMSTPDFNVAKFAFKYVDSMNSDEFKIQTLYMPYNPEEYATGHDEDPLKNVTEEGYLRWVNGCVVVDNGYAKGDVFNMNEDETRTPTANEEITAEGSVVVAGVNGAVVVKGAEGKSVIVSTILGKVVANEVLTSDNATIAAPAGVVVVSVDGESFKVVVK